MDDVTWDLGPSLERCVDQGTRMAEKVVSAAQPGAVFGEPVTAGGYTIITASEVTAAGGFGSGACFGPTVACAPGAELTAGAGEGQPGVRAGGGGGGGGGGVSVGRPVAVIAIGPDGVKVKPVVDVTKVGLVIFTALGAVLVNLVRMRRTARG